MPFGHVCRRERLRTVECHDRLRFQPTLQLKKKNIHR